MSVKSQHAQRKLTRDRGAPGGQFKPGESVYHSRLGVGTIVAEWGCWVDTDPEYENDLVINGAGIFEVEFSDSGQRSVNAESLVSARALPADGQEIG